MLNDNKVNSYFVGFAQNLTYRPSTNLFMDGKYPTLDYLLYVKLENHFIKCLKVNTGWVGHQKPSLFKCKQV